MVDGPPGDLRQDVEARQVSVDVGERALAQRDAAMARLDALQKAMHGLTDNTVARVDAARSHLDDATKALEEIKR